jgi:hypothetical protein
MVFLDLEYESGERAPTVRHRHVDPHSPAELADSLSPSPGRTCRFRFVPSSSFPVLPMASMKTSASPSDARSSTATVTYVTRLRGGQGCTKSQAFFTSSGEPELVHGYTSALEPEGHEWEDFEVD